MVAKAVEADGHSTQPPYRYTEASLVKKLEEEGIGRPSTYASTISTLQDRSYVIKKGNELIPTFTAFCVTHLLERQFADLVDIRFTAEMEDELDDIAAGDKAWDDLVSGFYLGNEDDGIGLRERLASGEVEYPEIPLGKDPETGEVVIVKVGKYGPYVRRGEGGADNAASVPEYLAPDELSVEVAVGLINAKRGGPIAHTDEGRAITLNTGRYGKYLELEQTEEEKASKKKPRRTSVPRDLADDDLTPEAAKKLIGLPRVVGQHPDDGEEITASLGPYGPYVKKGKDYRSLGSWEEACDVTVERAVELLAQPKPGRRGGQKKVLKEIGEVEGAVGPVNLLDGRYGPYVTDGKTNASIPKGTDPDSVDAAMAKELLDARRNAPKKRRGRAKKSTKSRAKKKS